MKLSAASRGVGGRVAGRGVGGGESRILYQKVGGDIFLAVWWVLAGWIFGFMVLLSLFGEYL